MLVVIVNVRVLPESVDAFKAATLENARASRLEPGIARFDVVIDKDDPTRFALIEVYRDEQAPVAHKNTPHYLIWRDTVASMMASPRTSQKFENLSPPDADWEMPGTH